MARYDSSSAFVAQQNSRLIDNNAGLITPANVRSVINDVADNFFYSIKVYDRQIPTSPTSGTHSQIGSFILTLPQNTSTTGEDIPQRLFRLRAFTETGAYVEAMITEVRRSSSTAFVHRKAGRGVAVRVNVTGSFLHIHCEFDVSATNEDGDCRIQLFQEVGDPVTTFSSITARQDTIFQVAVDTRFGSSVYTQQDTYSGSGVYSVNFLGR